MVISLCQALLQEVGTTLRHSCSTCKLALALRVLPSLSPLVGRRSVSFISSFPADLRVAASLLAAVSFEVLLSSPGCCCWFHC